jgi:uncharacterized Zn-binding protein involved in type VI secretion
MTGRPAARVSDMHTCPMLGGAVPHVGGAVLTAPAPEVLASGLPLAGAGSQIGCVGALTVVASGSATVLVAGRPVARMGDVTAHGGVLVGGAPTVLVGG